MYSVCKTQKYNSTKAIICTTKMPDCCWVWKILPNNEAIIVAGCLDKFPETGVNKVKM